MKYTIIADSSCDLKNDYIKSSKVNLVTIPLVITISGKDIIDEESLDTENLVVAMKANKDRPQTACPSPEAFADAMRSGNENIICVTLTSKLSGTNNAARLGAESVLAENKGKNIFVLDTLSTSAAMIIIIDRLVELIESGKYSFEEIVAEIEKVSKSTRLRFLLQDLGNLVKTGRMSKVKGVIASTLNIHLICGENGEGEIQQFAKAIGTKKAIRILSEFPGEKKDCEKDTPIVITHCHNTEDAEALKDLIEKQFGFTNIKIMPMRGLATFYANEKGLILAY